MEIKTGKIFKRTRKAIESGKKVIIHKGGTGSGKTYDLTLFIIMYMAMNTPNKVFTIVSESKPHLDIGVIRYSTEILARAGLTEMIEFNKTKSFYSLPNGSVVEFFSADRIGKALGARRYLLYGNEINTLKQEVWEELARRSEIVIGDFNPTSEFWLESWLRYYDDTLIIKSNFLDNPFLPETEKQRIEKRASLDKNFKRIHIDCEYGISEGLVFEKFTIVDEMPELFKKETYGLDFGYTNDPATLIHRRQNGNDIYFDELFYRTGMLNKDIVSQMQSNGLRVRNDVIYADSAEPKSIDDIALSGYNCKPATDAKKSINARIDKLKSMNIHVTKRSVNLIRELRNYFWETDKTGKPTNKPTDSFNHAIDAMGYSINDLLSGVHPGTARSKPATPRNAI